MKSTTTFLLGAALATSGWLVTAPQATGPATVAIINGDRVLEGSNVGRQARDQLESRASDWQSRIDSASQELQQMQQRRQEQALTLNDEALSRLNSDIEEKTVEIQRMNDDARRELSRLEQQMTLQVNQQLGPLVEQFASGRSIDLIFDSSRASGLLYFSNTRDVTDDFLALVNQSDGGAGDQQQQQQQ